MNKKNELAKNTLVILAGKICTQFISFLLLPLYTTVLISSEFGLVDLATTYIGLLVPIITLQLESALFRYLVDNRNNEKEKINIISNVFTAVFIQIIVCFIGTFIISYFVKIDYKYYIFGMIISTIFSNLLLQISRGFGNNIIYSIGSVIAGSFTIIFNVLFLVIFKLGPTGMFLSIILANFMCSIYIFKQEEVYKYIDYKCFSKEFIKKLLKYSVPLVPNGIIWWIVNVSDRTLITIFLGTSANGIYAISNKFSGVFISIYNIFNTSWTESASLHIDTEDKDEFFSSTISSMFKLFSAVCIGIISYMPFIFPLMINSQYIEAYNYIPILMISTLFNVFVGLISVVYIAKKLTKEIAKTSFLAGIINIVTNLLLIKFIGIYAAALSTLLSFVVMAVYRYIDVQKYVKIKFGKKLIVGTITMLVFSTFLYYQNNLFLNIINIIVVTIYAFNINKDFLVRAIKIIKNKKYKLVRIK